MILLDTNVVSEAMKPEPDPAVRRWLDEQAAETLYLSSVTIAELMFGIGALPKGKRKDRLAAALEGVLELFADRILPFDTNAARRYSDVAAKARAAGKGFPHTGRLYRRHSGVARFCRRIPRRQRVCGRRPHCDRPLDRWRLNCVGSGGTARRRPPNTTALHSPSGAEIPHDGRDQQGENHRVAAGATNLQDEFDRQQRDDAVGHGPGGNDHTQKVEEAGPYDGRQRGEDYGRR